MKTASIILALAALLFAEVASAAGAIVTSLTGTVQVQTGAAAPRLLRLGDPVIQGDTVITGAASSAVLRFDDGQVAALTANSRMQVSQYVYDAPSKSGNVFLSLVVGGMRAITGLIGHNSPASVNYRAATATIGIRGTDIDLVTDATTASVVVNDGEVTFTYNGQTVVVPAGQGASGTSGTVSTGAAQQILNQLSPALQNAIGGLDALNNAISNAVQTNAGQTINTGTSTGTPGQGVPSGGAGGGAGSTTGH